MRWWANTKGGTRGGGTGAMASNGFSSSFNVNAVRCWTQEFQPAAKGPLMHSTMCRHRYSPAQSTKGSKSPRRLSSAGETVGICYEAYIDPAVQQSTDIAMERHYTIAEIATLWHLNYKTVRRFFGSEPGVLIFGPGERRFKRSHVSMRVPETVMLRVHRRCRQSN